MEKSKEESDINRLFVLLVVGIVAVVFLYAIAIVIATRPISRVSVEAAGTFGDSFGPLTSLFSGLAFVGLIWTILLQKVELKLQRRELVEARRQSSRTRIMTITQNQVSAYRSELAPFKFSKIGSVGELYGLHEMLYAMATHIENMTDASQKGELKPKEHLSKLVSYLESIAHSINSYRALIDGLYRCCKGNRYLLTNEDISASEAQDIKNLFFAEIPTGLMTFVFHLHTALEAYAELHMNAKITSHGMFDPMASMESSCSLILSYQELKFTEESLASDRKQKWIFAP